MSLSSPRRHDGPGDTMADAPGGRLVFPIEIQLMIYEQMLEGRVVILKRKVLSSDDKKMSSAAVRLGTSVAAFQSQWFNPGTEENRNNIEGVRRFAAAVDATMGGINQDSEGVAGIKTITTTTAAPPIVLYINRASRKLGLQKYKLSFALPDGESRVYFHFDLDTLAFDGLKNLVRLECGSSAVVEDNLAARVGATTTPLHCRPVLLIQGSVQISRYYRRTRTPSEFARLRRVMPNLHQDTTRQLDA